MLPRFFSCLRLIVRHSGGTVVSSKRSFLKDSVSLGYRGEREGKGGAGAELLITLYVHYTLFLLMLFNIKLLRIFFWWGRGHPGVSVWTSLD